MVEKKPIDKGIFIGNGDWSRLIQSKIRNKINITAVYNSKTVKSLKYKQEKYVFIIIGPFLNNEFLNKYYDDKKKFFIEKPFFFDQHLNDKYKNNFFINNLHLYNSNIHLIKRKIQKDTKEINIKIGSKKKSKNVYFEWAPHVFTILEILDNKAIIKSIKEYNSVFEINLLSTNGLKINVKFGFFDKIFSIKYIDKYSNTYLHYDDIKKVILYNSHHSVIKSYPLDVSLQNFLSNKSTDENYNFNSKISKRFIKAFKMLSS